MSETSGLAPADTPRSKARPPAAPTPPTSSRLIPTLNQILASPSHSDTLLQTLCYTSLLGSSLLARLAVAGARAQARALIAQAIALPPNTTLRLSAVAVPPSRLLVGARRLRAFSALVADVRVFARLWGLLAIYRWARRVWASRDADPARRAVEAAQVVLNVAFQGLENLAYLSSKGAWGWDETRQARAWLWSSRFWAMHIGLDLLRLWRERLLRARKEEEEGKLGLGEEKKLGLGEQKKLGLGEEEREEHEAWRRKWWKDLVVNAAFGPLTIHWGTEQGLLGDFWIGLLGSVAGVAGMSDVLREIEKSA